MSRAMGWSILGSASLALVLTGCVPGFLREAPPALPQFELCQALPQACKNRVHVFFIHGLDPLDARHLEALRERIIELGFIKASIGWAHHKGHFHKEIVRLHQEEPHARFLLIGQRYGSGVALELAEQVQAAGVPVDLVLCIDGTHEMKEGAVCAERIIHVHSCKHDGGPHAAPGEVHHLSASAGKVVNDSVTVSILLQALADSAQRVPILSILPPLPPAPGLQPRVLPPPIDAPRDEWDFLKPDDSPEGALGTRPLHQAGAAHPATLQTR